MSSRRRTKIEIIYDMLKAIQNKGGVIKPTHLLYKSNLSHNKMQEYIRNLQAKGMIAEKDAGNGSKVYMITDKGLKYIAEFKQIRQFSDAFGITQF
ncbi:MAG: winged helix-turn-helix domain-containing protein [Candidatus Woesearchaeota archaeon]